ncbi:transporter substrate-binding domain-containing protein [Arthrobacter crystallopoietes]|uniref:substrate-binding periplasmic protein n=1 Tax=Crystallibacter crystallopoietes TaxID=37928 RepID=UPI003D1A5687
MKANSRKALAVAAALSAGLLAGCSASSGDTAEAAGPKVELTTLTPGTIKVAMMPYLPYVGEDDGKLEGLDGEILTAAAEKLGYKIEVEQTDFSGMLSAVQTNRVDVALGSIFWTPEREETGIFTDPPYYSPVALAVGDGKTYKKAEDLEGLHMGTVTGYSWTASIQDTPGATLHTYPDANGTFNDLKADRIAVGMLDPLVISYTEQKNPQLSFNTQYIESPTAEEIEEHPGWQYLTPAMTGFYVAKQSQDLADAISEQIGEMYADGTMEELVTKWGGDPEAYLKPSPGMLELRQDADRDADWALPTID